MADETKDNLTPYEILGVQPDATKKQINDAYRKKARTEHPDAGGDREKFDLLTKARDLLMDDELRAEYDRTGLFTRGQEPDNIEAFALQNMATILQSILASQIDLRIMAPISDINAQALKNIQLNEQAQRLNAKQIRRAKTMLTVFQATDEKGKEYVEFFTKMMKDQIAELQKMDEKLSRDIKIAKKLMEILTHLDFVPPPYGEDNGPESRFFSGLIPGNVQVRIQP